MGNFLAKQIKDQTDSILRRRQVSPGSSMTVRGGTTTPGTGPGGAPEVVEPNRDLARHKTSADHDGRYYTKTASDNKFALLSVVPRLVRQAFEQENEIVFEHGLGANPITQVVGSDLVPYGAGNYGADRYGGLGDVMLQNPVSIKCDSENQITVVLDGLKNGEVICVG